MGEVRRLVEGDKKTSTCDHCGGQIEFTWTAANHWAVEDPHDCIQTLRWRIAELEETVREMQKKTP